MMGHWLACFIVIIVDLAFGNEIKIDESFVIKQTEPCPDVGYFFKREPSPNALRPGPCFLCFCQNNNTALCWARESYRCDVEKYHYHRIGRETRFRRSPAALSDIFFRDATRDFFNKQLPEQCKPFEASFSEGCPPVDWCIGCTVCDCDANGRWDCHILSFCDGKENKKKVTPRRSHGRKKSGVKKPNKYQTSKLKSQKPKSTTTPKPKRKVFKRKSVQNKGPFKPKNQAHNKKPNETNNKPHIKTRSTSQGKPINRQVVKKVIVKRPMRKKMQTMKPQIQNKVKVNASKVIVKKDVSTHSPVSLQRANLMTMLNSDNDTLKLGQKIVKHVMNSLTKILRQEMEKINATRIERSVNNDGKDCGGVKNGDKESFNVKSNAPARYKNKHKQQARSDNRVYARKKREILNETQAAMENVTIISLQREISKEKESSLKTTAYRRKITESTAVLPLPTVKHEKNLKTSPSTDTTTSAITTSLQNDYYEYSLHKTNMNVTYNSTVSSLTNLPRYVPLSMVTFIPEPNNTRTVDENAVQVNVTITPKKPESNPEFNDIKFTKWYIIKINQDKQKLKKLILPKPQEIKPEKVPITRKDSIQEPITGNEIVHKLNVNNEFLNQPSTKIIDITTILRQKYKEIIPTEVSKTLDLYKLLFKNYTEAPRVQHKPYIQNKSNGLHLILQNLLTETNKNNTAAAHSNPKVDLMRHLRTFFNKIFDNKRNVTRKYKIYGMGSKEDRTLQILCENFGPCKIKKKNKFILKYKLKRLNDETENILRSIRIIKGLLHLLELPNNNEPQSEYKMYKPHSFQSDVQKFSAVLKGKYNADKNITLTETQVFQIDYIKKNTQVFMESIRHFSNILKEILALTKSNSNNTAVYPKRKIQNTASYKKIKELLTKYNLVQNTFMRRMYQLINGFDKKSTEKPQIQVSEDDVKIYNDVVIEKYSTNIIENLRRLKNLAQALSYKRKKRHTMVTRDDSLEYLLTIMEFLIKKENNPLDLSPANDGIDFLIDAIKNAPAIKPLRKQVLDFTQMSPATIGPSAEDLSKEKYSDSDMNQVSSKEVNNTLKDDSISKDNSNVRVDSTENDITATVYYRKFNDMTESYNDITYENSTDFGASKKRREENTEKIGFDKFESSIDDTKKFDMYAAETEEETTISYSTMPASVDGPPVTNITRSLEDTTVFNIPESTPRNNISTSESQESTSDDKKSKLDWIEESFDKEFREFGFVNVTFPTSSPSPPSTSTQGFKSIENMKAYMAISDESKKKSQELKADDVMHRKEVAFLHSLDYGTEKPDFEETDSKDDGRSDDEPSYFV